MKLVRLNRKVNVEEYDERLVRPTEAELPPKMSMSTLNEIDGYDYPDIESLNRYVVQRGNIVIPSDDEDIGSAPTKFRCSDNVTKLIVNEVNTYGPDEIRLVRLQLRRRFLELRYLGADCRGCAYETSMRCPGGARGDQRYPGVTYSNCEHRLPAPKRVIE